MDKQRLGTLMGVLLIALGVYASIYPLQVSGISGGDIVNVVLTAPTTADLNKAVTLTATLINSETKQVIPGVGVEFSSSGGTLSKRFTVTNDNGDAAVSWTSPSVSGTYTVTAKVSYESFSQYSTYSSPSIDYTKLEYAWSSTSRSIAVATPYVPPPAKLSTLLVVAISGSTLPPDTATQASVTLTTTSGVPVSGDVHVRASWRTTLGTGVILVATGSDGKAVVNFSTPTDSGSYSLLADYLGSEKYEASSGGVTFTVDALAPDPPTPSPLSDGTVSVPLETEAIKTPTLNMYSVGFVGLGLVTLALANRRKVTA